MEAIWEGSSFSPGNTPYGFYDSDVQFTTGSHSVDKFSIGQLKG